MIIYYCAIVFGLSVWIVFLLLRNNDLRNMLYNERAIRKSQIDIDEKFKNIANEILLESHGNFLNIAKETFDKILNNEKVELEKKQNNFISFISPIKETLVVFHKQIAEIEKERIDAYGDLRRHVQDMMVFQQEIRKETATLNKALSNPFMTGQWGEMQLKRVVEISGMMAHCDFFEQKQSEDSRARPDMIIKLPGNRNIIVDAKAPIETYMNAVNSGDENLMETHARRVKAHIKSLGQKAYWEQFYPSPEFVLMFLPGESFFSSAIKKDPTLIEFGVRENVIVATPITLIALLKSISFSWQQEAIAVNAKKIGKAGQEVFANLEKLLLYSKDFEKKMHKNIEEYSMISTFIEKNIMPSADRLKNLRTEIVPDEPASH